MEAGAEGTTKATDVKADDVKAPEVTNKDAAAPVENKVETDATKVAGGPPEKYDLKLPKDSGLDAAYLEKFQNEAKAMNLSQAQAQAYLERDSSLKKGFVDEQQAYLKQKAVDWFEEAKADKEIGGEGFSKTAETAKRAVDYFASDQLRKVLNETGLGNHPELIRCFAKVGKLIGDDQLVVGQSAQAKRSPQEVLYGKK